MSFMRKVPFFLVACLVSLSINPVKAQSVSSPDGYINATVWIADDGQAMYSVKYRGQTLLDSSNLGIKDGSFDLRHSLTLVGEQPVEKIDVSYDILTAKRKLNH